jgi:hypothetical protein
MLEKTKEVCKKENKILVVDETKYGIFFSPIWKGLILFF